MITSFSYSSGSSTPPRVAGSFAAGLVLVGFLCAATPAAAQRIEASVSGGYTFSEGITVDEPRFILGNFYDEIAVDSGASINATFGVFVGPGLEVEFLWSRQSSELAAENGIKLPISEMTIYNYMGNLVFNAGARDGRLVPFFFGGLGATYYTFGSLLVEQPIGLGPGEIDNNAQFSTNWGGGVKMYFIPQVGIRLTGRWTPTFITSQAEGVWCDPWYGCWAVADTEYSNQFEVSAGATVRF